MSEEKTPLVGIVMGSENDWPKIKGVAVALDQFGHPLSTDAYCVQAHVKAQSPARAERSRAGAVAGIEARDDQFGGVAGAGSGACACRRRMQVHRAIDLRAGEQIDRVAGDGGRRELRDAGGFARNAR